MRKYFDTIVNSSNGDPVPNAIVTVTTTGGLPVQLYAGNGTSPITTPAINQVTTNSLGLFQFYVADGTYTLTYAYGSGTPVSVTGVEIYDLASIALNSSISLKGATTASIPNNAETFVGWNVENFKYNMTHSNGSNIEIVTTTATGLMQVNVTIEFAANATGVRKALLYREADMLQEWEVIPGAAQIVTVGGSYLVTVTAGQSLTIKAFQNSGGALNIDMTKSNFSAILLKAL